MFNLIAHRGKNNKYKENTYEAIIDSLNTNYIDGVEFDVRMTKDKKIVVIHDMTINRVSDGRGFVRNMNLSELRKYNFGAKENPAKITTLDELLKSIKSNKKILIEIKEEFDNKIIVDLIYNIIKKYKHLKIYITSFNYELIKYFKKKYPDVMLSVIVGFSINDNKDNYFDFNVVQYGYLDEIKNNNEIFVWPINSKKLYNELIKKYKYINIITDKAYLLKN